MEAGGQPHASRFIPMRRISPPVQMNRRLSEPLIQSGYLRGEKIFVPFLGCFLDSRSEMSCIQNVHGDVLICPFLCVSIGCPSFRSSVCLLAAHLSVPLCVYWLLVCPFLCVSIGCPSVRSFVCLLAARLSVPLCVYWLLICPFLCVSIGCPSVRKFARLNSSAAEWILKNTGRGSYDSGSHQVQDKTTVRNVGNCLPQETAWHPRRIHSSVTLLWESQIVQSSSSLPAFLYKDQWKLVSVILVVSRDWNGFSELRRMCNSELGRRS